MTLRSILQNAVFKAFRHQEIYIVGMQTDADIDAHICTRADRIYRPVGTCTMGTDPMAAVDPNGACTACSACVRWTPPSCRA